MAYVCRETNKEILEFQKSIISPELKDALWNMNAAIESDNPCLLKRETIEYAVKVLELVKKAKELRKGEPMDNIIKTLKEVI